MSRTRRPGWLRSRASLRRPRVALGVALGAALAVVLGIEVGLPAPSSQAATSSTLPRLNVTSDYVTGISSGGYMATQLQVAYSSRVKGAGIFSAGPYYCAQDQLTIALEACTNGPLPRDMAAIYGETANYEADGRIDPTSNLAGIPTYFFHGTKDPTVITPVADDLKAFYDHYGVPLAYRNTTTAGHGWISPLGPVACADTAAPFINNCSPYDAEADLLTTMFGAVKPPTAAPKGTVTAFSQDPYAVPATVGSGDPTRSGAVAIGMGSTGYLYTPKSCAGGASCKVVVALHGCRQTAEQIGTTFVEKSGLNAYADTNNFVVLYPQARPDDVFGNPKGCWDWWGYLGPNDADYGTKRGPQMQTVMNMVTALGG